MRVTNPTYAHVLLLQHCLSIHYPGLWDVLEQIQADPFPDDANRRAKRWMRWCVE